MHASRDPQTVPVLQRRRSRHVNSSDLCRSYAEAKAGFAQVNDVYFQTTFTVTPPVLALTRGLCSGT